jgi:hypothetical protein
MFVLTKCNPGTHIDRWYADWNAVPSTGIRVNWPESANTEFVAEWGLVASTKNVVHSVRWGAGLRIAGMNSGNPASISITSPPDQEQAPDRCHGMNSIQTIFRWCTSESFREWLGSGSTFREVPFGIKSKNYHCWFVDTGSRQLLV